MSITGTTGFMFEYQAPAVLNQAAPVNGTWYDILAATDYVRVYGIAVNVEDTDETLEVQAIIDGETIQAAGVAATHSTIYFAARYLQAINRTDQIVLTTATTIQLFNAQAFLLEGHNVQIQVRKTTAAGAGNLTGIVQYGVLKHASI